MLRRNIVRQPPSLRNCTASASDVRLSLTAAAGGHYGFTPLHGCNSVLSQHQQRIHSHRQVRFFTTTGNCAPASSTPEECGQPTPMTRPYLFGSPSPIISDAAPSALRLSPAGVSTTSSTAARDDSSAALYVTPFVTAREYSHRRLRAFAAMPRNSIMLLPLQDGTTRTHDIYNPFRQESNALYLSGCKEMGVGSDAMPMLVMAKCAPNTFAGCSSLSGTDGSADSSCTVPPLLRIGRDDVSGCELVSMLFIRKKDRGVELWDGPATGPLNGDAVFNGCGAPSGGRGGGGSSTDEGPAAPITCRSSDISNVVTTVHALLMRMAQSELAFVNQPQQQPAVPTPQQQPRPRPRWYADRTFSALPKLYVRSPTHVNFGIGGVGRTATVTIDVAESAEEVAAALALGSAGSSALLEGQRPMDPTAAGASSSCGKVGKGGGAAEGDEVDLFSLSVDEVRAMLKESMSGGSKQRRKALGEGAEAYAKSLSSSSSSLAAHSLFVPRWPQSAIQRHARKEAEYLLASSSPSSASSSTGASGGTSNGGNGGAAAVVSSTSVDLSLSVSYAHPWYAVMDMLRSVRVVALRRGASDVVGAGSPPSNNSRSSHGNSSSSGDYQGVCCYSYAFPSTFDGFIDPLGKASQQAGGGGGGGVASLAVSTQQQQASGSMIDAADVAPNTLMRRRLLFPRTPIFEVSEEGSLSQNATTDAPVTSGIGGSPSRPASPSLSSSNTNSGGGGVFLRFIESLVPVATHLTKAERGEFMDNVSPSSSPCASVGNNAANVFLPFVCLRRLWEGAPMGVSSALTAAASKAAAAERAMREALGGGEDATATAPSSSPSSPPPLLPHGLPVLAPPLPRPKSLAIVRDPEGALLRPLRSVKSPAELGIMQRAAMISAAAFTTAMRRTMVMGPGRRNKKGGGLASHPNAALLPSPYHTEADIYHGLQSVAWAEGLRLNNRGLSRSRSRMDDCDADGGADGDAIDASPLPSSIAERVCGQWYSGGSTSPTLGYIPVVASGANALCIHWIDNTSVLGRYEAGVGGEGGGSARMADGAVIEGNRRPHPRLLRTSRRHYPHQQWVLVDAGAEVEGYSCDCSRSWPVVPFDYAPPQTLQGTAASPSSSDVHSRLYRTLLHVQRRLIQRVNAIGDSSSSSGASSSPLSALSIPILHKECVAMLHEALTVSHGGRGRRSGTPNPNSTTHPESPASPASESAVKSFAASLGAAAWDHTDARYYLCDLDPAIVTPRMVASVLMPHNVGHAIGMDLHERIVVASGGSGASGAALLEAVAAGVMAEEGVAGGGADNARQMAHFASLLRDRVTQRSSSSMEPTVSSPSTAVGTAPSSSPSPSPSPPSASMPPPSDTVPKRLSAPITAGMMLTVEPGLYLPSAAGVVAARRGSDTCGVDAVDEAARALFCAGPSSSSSSFPDITALGRGVGMRIEDNVLVLPSGSGGSTGAVPSGANLLRLRASYIRTAFKAWLASQPGAEEAEDEDASASSLSVEASRSMQHHMRAFYAEQCSALYHPHSLCFAEAMGAFDRAMGDVAAAAAASATATDACSANALLLSLFLSDAAILRCYALNVVVTTACIPKDWGIIADLTHGLA